MYGTLGINFSSVINVYFTLSASCNEPSNVVMGQDVIMNSDSYDIGCNHSFSGITAHINPRSLGLLENVPTIINNAERLGIEGEGISPLIIIEDLFLLLMC